MVVINLGVDLVVVLVLVVDGGNIVKQLWQFGYKGLIVGGNGFNIVNVFLVCQKDCDGVLVVQVYSFIQKSVVNQKFVSEYCKFYKKDLFQFVVQVYVGIQVFVDVLKVIDKKKKFSIWDFVVLCIELNKQVLVGQYDMLLGELCFDKDGEVNQKEFFVVCIKMKDVKNGFFVFGK